MAWVLELRQSLGLSLALAVMSVGMQSGEFGDYFVGGQIPRAKTEGTPKYFSENSFLPYYGR